jgi:hypothetical protein
MSDISLEAAIEAFEKLTTTLQECIHSRDINGAVDLAQQRHDTLVNLFERSEFATGKKINCARTALNHVHDERLLAKSHAKHDRSAFVTRKSAYLAYALNAA